jgi:hypothetical protein
MALDVMRNPPSVEVMVTWYRASQTTPFAVCGHIGPVLAMLEEKVYGPWAQEIWFGDNGFETSEGDPIDSDEIHWWALLPASPDAKPDADNL